MRLPRDSTQTLQKILIDARMVSAHAHGFSRYVTRLAEGFEILRQKKPLRYEPVFILDPRQKTLEAEPIFNCFTHVMSSSSFLSLSELWEIPKILRRENASLYHSPTFSSLLKSPCPWVMTIHDLNHLHFGSFSKKLYYRLLLKPFALASHQILTVSEASKSELCTWFSVSADRVEVVKNALDPKWVEAVSDSQISLWGLKERDYFFCLSNSKPHKNIALLIQAYQDACQKFQQGKKHFPKLVLSFPWPNAPEGVLCLPKLTDLEIRALMQNAGAVVFPSLYEGFGIPPLEATLLGVPVIASRIPPHIESLGELVRELKGEWFDAHSLSDLSASLIRAVDRNFERASHEQMLRARQELFERYSSLQLAEAMDRIYRRVLGLELA